MRIINLEKAGPGETGLLESQAFRHGAGFFTTTAVNKSIPLWLEDHIERLKHSLADFSMGEIDSKELKRLVCEWIVQHGLAQGFLRIMAWRERNEAAVYIQGGVLDDAAGLPLILKSPFYLHSHQPLLAYKSLTYWTNALAYQEALKKNCMEAVFLNERDELCEGSRSNIFWIYDGTLYTPDPSCGLLPGICRDKVISLARQLGIRVNIGRYRMSVLQRAQEIFLTNSVRGLRAVAFDPSKLPNCPGEIFQLINRHYEDLVDDYITRF